MHDLYALYTICYITLSFENSPSIYVWAVHQTFRCKNRQGGKGEKFSVVHELGLMNDILVLPVLDYRQKKRMIYQLFYWTDLRRLRRY